MSTSKFGSVTLQHPKMLEDDTYSSQSTQDSGQSNQQQNKTSKKGQKTGIGNKVEKKQRQTRKGLTKLDKSLFRTYTNPKGIIKPVDKSKKGKQSKAAKSKVLKAKKPGKDIVKKLQQLKTPNQDISVFTKNILQALFELSEKND